MKPRIEAVTLTVGRAWSSGGMLYQEKADGGWDLVDGVELAPRLAGVPLVTELVRPKAGGFLMAEDRARLARFGAFRVIHDIDSPEPTSTRWRQLCALATLLPENCRMARSGPGGEFLEAELAAGGEGVVAKPWDMPFGAGWLKCKALQTFYCVVTGFVAGSQSVTIRRMADGFNVAKGLYPAGKVALRGGKCDQVRVGSVIKVEGMGLTPAGRIREPRVCRDGPESWLVAF